MEKTLRKTKTFLFTCLILLVAIILTGFGVALFIHANLGSDTITVFIDGLRKVFSISLGDASRIYNVSALLLALLLAYQHIGWTSIVYALSTGFFIDYFDVLLQSFQFAQQGIALRLIVVMIGQLCIVIAFALLVRYGSGMDQLDAIAYGLNQKTKIAYPLLRTLFDILLIVIGFAMGGVIGIGSIIAMLTTGYGIDLLIRYVLKEEKKETMIGDKI